MLFCSNNLLENLDVSNCRLEWGLFCQDNKIKMLKLKRKSDMAYLWCQRNQLKELDIREILEIQSIKCQKNLFNVLDLTTTDQTWLNDLSCDSTVNIIGRNEEYKIEEMRIKKGVVFYEFDCWM